MLVPDYACLLFVCSTINKYKILFNSLVCVYILSCLLSLMCEFSSYVYLNFVEKRKYVEEKCSLHYTFSIHELPR